MVSEFSHHYAAVIVATHEKSRVCVFSCVGMFFESILEKKRLVCIGVAIHVLLWLNNNSASPKADHKQVATGAVSSQEKNCTLLADDSLRSK